MKTRLNFTLFIVFVCLITISSVFAQDKQLKVDFPEIEGWEKSDLVRYQVAELGYSVNYESETGGKVTVYVYNGGHKKIPNDAKDKLIKSEIEKAKSEIQMVEKMGRYKNVKEIKNETIMLGGEKGKIECVHKLFSMTVGEANLTTEIFVFGYRNHFIKLRATRYYEKDGVKNQPMSVLLAAIDKLFADEGEIALGVN